MESENRTLRAELSELEKHKEDKERLLEKYQSRISEQWKDITTQSLELSKMREDLELLHAEKLQYQEHIARLKESEEKTFHDSLLWKAQIRNFEEEKSKLIKENEDLQRHINELAKINSKLIGHNNPRQKIQHHVKIKQENNILKKEKAQISEMLVQKEQQLRKLEQELKKLQSQSQLPQVITKRKECISMPNEDKENEVPNRISLSSLSTNSLHIGGKPMLEYSEPTSKTVQPMVSLETIAN